MPASTAARSLFFEDPALAGADDFALPSTYWKDSAIDGNRRIRYPVVLLLPHVQALCALRCAGALLEDSSLLETADNMVQVRCWGAWQEAAVFVGVEVNDDETRPDEW